MLKDLPQTFATLRDCWITGGCALSLAPEDWRPFLAGVDNDTAERRLLALAGQALEVALRPTASETLTPHPDLPRLRLLTLPDSLRPLCRQAMKIPNIQMTQILRLVEQRGFSLHPLDWMPNLNEEVPDLYAPWVDWQNGLDQKSETLDAADELDETTWDHFYPAERRALLKAMRKKAPARARDLIAIRASQEPAEKRLALAELLETGLCEDDVAYLQSLSSDRSGKVKALAARFLSRLSHVTGDLDSPELHEFADFFVIETQHQQTRVRLKRFNSNAQEYRCGELFSQFTLGELAAALNLNEEVLVDAWVFTKPENSYLFATLIVRTASDTLVARMNQRLCNDPPKFKVFLPRLFTILLPRLDRAEQQRVVMQLLNDEDNDDLGLLNLVDYADLVDTQTIMTSVAYGKIKANLTAHFAKERNTDALLSTAPLAMVATPDAARAITEDLIKTFNVFPALPELALLRLNYALRDAALETSPATSQTNSKER